jgi:hypothetical protein
MAGTIAVRTTTNGVRWEAQWFSGKCWLQRNDEPVGFVEPTAEGLRAALRTCDRTRPAAARVARALLVAR